VLKKGLGAFTPCRNYRNYGITTLRRTHCILGIFWELQLHCCTTWPLQIHSGVDSVAIETHNSQTEDVNSSG